MENVSEVKIKSSLRYSYLSSYVYLLLEENLIALNLLFHKEEFLDSLEKSLINPVMHERRVS